MARASLALLSAFVLLAGCSDGEEAPPSADPATPSTPLQATVAFQGSGTLTGAGATTSPASPQGCDALQEEGVDVMHHDWEIPGDVNGTPADAIRLEVTLTLVDDTLLDADLYLEAPDGEVLGESIAFNPQTGPTETVVVEDTLGPGTYQVVVRACAGQGGYELAGEAVLRTRVPSNATQGGGTS